MVNNIGRQSTGRQSLQRQPLGRISGKSRKEIIAKTRRKMEQWRDRARQSLLEARRRYKFKVKRNEELMQKRKLDREKNLNISVVALMPGKKFAKIMKNAPAKWSSIPTKPKYSRVKPRARIYGERWKFMEQGKTR